MQARTRGYVDGFNLYKGRLESSRFKGLDLAALCDRLAGSRVDRVAYCTAHLVALPQDPGVVARQYTYLRALSGNPRVDVFLGKFKRRTPRMRKVPEPNCGCCLDSSDTPSCACCSGSTIQVVKFEEKGSDVQLAVQLVKDAFTGAFDRALVISNDSDLQPAVDVVMNVAGKEVIVVNPRTKGHALLGSARAYLSAGQLDSSQMPSQVRDSEGQLVNKPASWR